ncbi:MAG TPA: methyltransferase domain-containing protein [Bryobacteraceae bacterium]|nr:methyltransferase domain-containing protein [Bryobacteraceae bacterium]
MIEFTGERVIPGEVNDDLWAEHASRYAFARRYAHGRALDIGCGAGYGLAEIAQHLRFAIGIDRAPEAIAYARENYGAANIHFLQASAGALPFPDHFFHLVTAFEVIEHLPSWPDLLREAGRVVHPSGVFLVSTPNKLYYSESRAEHGPNPFHAHEFEYQEFRDALERCFAHVTIFLQNRQESLSFVPVDPSASRPESHLERAASPAQDANFFVALCSAEPHDSASFLYVPRAANLLREREHHIHLLEEELHQTKRWLEELIADHKLLQEAHIAQTQHLETQNRWALELESRWRAAQERIDQLQQELQMEQAAAAQVVEGYNHKVAELEEENRAKTQWALDTEARLTHELAVKIEELAGTVRLLDSAEATVVERTRWAQDLKQQIERLEAQLESVRQSRWVKLGRAAGLGPRVQD